MLKKILILLIITLMFSFFQVDVSYSKSKKQNADDAREGENSLEDLLRKFGVQDKELAQKIYAAIDTGSEWLMKKQNVDGSFKCYDTTSNGMYYPLGGTALAALAVKKSMDGLYEGDKKDLAKEIKKLDRKKKSGKITGAEDLRRKYLMENGKKEIEKRNNMQYVVEKSIEWLRKKYDELKRASGKDAQGHTVDGRRTYGIGVILMLLESYYTEKEEKKGKYIIGVNKKKIKPADLDWIKEMVQWLEDKHQINAKAVNPYSKNRDGAWRYPGPAQDGSIVDNSNTQYAVLGLKAASRMGVHIKKSQVWIDVCEYYIRTQDVKGPKVKRTPPAEDPNSGKYYFPSRYAKDPGFDYARGWGYLPVRDKAHQTTSAMTTSGLAALITAKSELYTAKVLPRKKKLEERIDKAINDGVCWLGHYFTVELNRNASGDTNFGWHYYYLYGLERVGVLGQTEFFGKHAWYLEGARFLVANQKQDKSWDSGSLPGDPNHIADTAFAVLFLKRATTPVKVPLKLPKPVITPVK